MRASFSGPPTRIRRNSPLPAATIRWQGDTISSLVELDENGDDAVCVHVHDFEGNDSAIVTPQDGAQILRSG